MAVKKLIEVALPLDAINSASSREKSIRHGHPSTLHIWWARRPLATARAVIWASLVDDPSSHPEIFPTEEQQKSERERLFAILSKLIEWENSNDGMVLNAAKEEIRKSVGSNLPALLDPFAGGGAIPLEAQRLGLKAYAQDLNPVAVTICKAMIEIPPRFADRPAVNPEAQRRSELDAWEGNAGLAADVAYYGKWMKDEAMRRIGHLYPEVNVPSDQGGGTATVVAWIWARTVKCPNPACGGTVPLVRTFDLVRKAGSQRHIDLVCNQDGSVSFVASNGTSSIDGTVGRKGAICPHCRQPFGLDYIRAEGKNKRIGEQLMAVIAGERGSRVYIAGDVEQEIAAQVERPDNYPDGRIAQNPRNFNTLNYGLESFADLYSNRQIVMLCTLSDLVKDAQEKAQDDAILAGMGNDATGLSEGGSGARAYGEAIGVYLAFIIDKLSDYHSAVCSWHIAGHNSGEKIGHTFGRQAIPMAWDYAEANPFSTATGCIDSMINWVVEAIAGLPRNVEDGTAIQAAAQNTNGYQNVLICMDPPYYDNINYADLSDYFYIWLRKSLRFTYRDIFATTLVPKTDELVATPYRLNRGKDGAKAFFENGMFEVLRRMVGMSNESLPLTIFYAFKQSEAGTRGQGSTKASTGWETMLSAIVRAGFSISGTWPVRTEMSSRSVATGANALASSIVLVCRKRPEDSPIATRREFVSTLKRELRPALDKLQTSNIAPVDLAQSAIGPGIGVYSRFSKVLEADGSEMTVRSALQIINQELDLYFSDQDGDLDRESRFCVELYTQSAFNEIRFGDADVLARAKNTSIEGIAAKGALSSAKGIVRLLERDEIRDTPALDFCWLFTQQLTHAMEVGGIDACAKLLKDVLDSRSENARALAYRLFSIADKKGWNQEAFAYNSLVTAWREIESKAAVLQAATPVQTTLDI